MTHRTRTTWARLALLCLAESRRRRLARRTPPSHVFSHAGCPDECVLCLKMMQQTGSGAL